MKYTIEVDQVETGNPQRGYHNYDTTVRFNYEGTSYFTEEREQQIAEAVAAGFGSWMWQTSAKQLGPKVWKVNHGYDSGD